MEKVTLSLTQQTMKTEKTDINLTKLNIQEDESLWKMFDSVASGRNILSEQKKRKSIYDQLLKKVLNARITEEFIKYKEKYIARKSSDNRTNLSLRGKLKSIVPDKFKKDEKKRKIVNKEGKETKRKLEIGDTTTTPVAKQINFDEYIISEDDLSGSATSARKRKHNEATAGEKKKVSLSAFLYY